jgi:hypothetical protein
MTPTDSDYSSKSLIPRKQVSCSVEMPSSLALTCKERTVSLIVDVRKLLSVSMCQHLSQGAFSYAVVALVDDL